MAGVFPNETKIYIQPVDTEASSVASSDAIKGEITNWSISGGGKDTAIVHAIGGDIEKEMPRDQIEFSFDVIIQNTSPATLDRWDSYQFGVGSRGTLDSATEAAPRSIFIEFATGSSFKSFATNNCKGFTFDPEMSADDMLKGTMNFKINPLTDLGVSNLQTSAIALSDIPNW